MSMWNRKRVGMLVDALGHFVNETDDAQMKSALSQLRQQAIDLEHRPDVSSSAAQKLQNDLCVICQQHALLGCTGVSASCHCDFVSIANLGLSVCRH